MKRSKNAAPARPTRKTPPARLRSKSSAERLAPSRALRLPREERERHIVQEAIRFFAEVGFEGDTRQLARRVNVTHPLLFRYFPSKDALIERVYEEVYLGRWNPYWELVIADHSLPIRERMMRFYKSYAQTILAYEWVRLFMFSGLKGADMNRRWFALVHERIVAPICRELRSAHGFVAMDKLPLSEIEAELVWGLNSRIFYFGVRKYVYGMPVAADVESLIEAEVATFFDGIAATLLARVPALSAKRLPARPQRIAAR